MRFTFLLLCFGFIFQSQSQEIVLTKISHPIQKDLYPESYWKVWVKDLKNVDLTIRDPETIRKVREIEYFNRFLLYVKMQTNTPQELTATFMDSFRYAPHYTAQRFIAVFPLNGAEYHYIWDAYEKEKAVFESLCNEVISSYDSKLINRLEQVREKDQVYRKQMDGKTDAELRANGTWQKQLELDKHNSEEIKRILDTIGYPGRSKVGYKNESTAFLVIQHSNLELMEFGLPLIEAAIKIGDLDPSYFAYLYDRIQLVKKLPQRYGTQSNLDGTIYNLSNPETVNERRNKYGLYPIKL